MKVESHQAALTVDTEILFVVFNVLKHIKPLRIHQRRTILEAFRNG